MILNQNDPRHGTIAGYMAHRRAEDEACISCKAAWRANVAAYRAKKQQERNASAD